MKNKLGKWLSRHKNAINAFAMSIAAIAVYGCRFKYYQPEEPEGLEEFCKKRLNK